MKPGNLCKQGAKSGGRRKMRIRYTHIESVGVRFFDFCCAKERKNNYGKKTVYF